MKLDIFIGFPIEIKAPECSEFTKNLTIVCDVSYMEKSY